MKKCITLLLTMTLFMTSVVGAFAETKVSNNDNSTNKKVIQITDRNSIEEFAQARGLDANKIDKLIHVYEESEQDENNISLKEIGGEERYIKKKGTNYGCGLEELRRVTGRGPGKVILKIGEAVELTIHGSFGLKLADFGAEFGIQFKRSYQISQEQWIDLKSGESCSIIAYPEYKYYHYEVWEDDPLYDDYLGTGYITKPIGVCFVVNRY